MQNIKKKIGSGLTKINVSPFQQKPPKQATIDCDHIYENIYISDANTAHNLPFLQGEGFTHIVNCAASLPNYFDDRFQYCRIDLNDSANQTLISAVQKFILFIEKSPSSTHQIKDLFTAPPALSSFNSFKTPMKTQVPSQKKILVHCKQGKSWAPTVVCGYLMWKLRFTFKQALEFVQKKRPKVDPNFGFLLEGSKDFEQYFFPKSPLKAQAPEEQCNIDFDFDQQQQNLDQNASVDQNFAKYQQPHFLLNMKLGVNPHSPDYYSPYRKKENQQFGKTFANQKVFQIKRLGKQNRVKSVNQNFLTFSQSINNQNQFTWISSNMSKQCQVPKSPFSNNVVVGHQLDQELLENQEDYNPSDIQLYQKLEHQQYEEPPPDHNQIFEQVKRQQDAYFQLQTSEIEAVHQHQLHKHFSVNHQLSSNEQNQLLVRPPSYQRNTDKDITYANALMNYQEGKQQQQFQRQRMLNFQKFQQNRIFKRIGKGKWSHRRSFKLQLNKVHRKMLLSTAKLFSKRVASINFCTDKLCWGYCISATKDQIPSGH